MRTLFLATAAFAALVMIMPVGAHAGVCSDMWGNRAVHYGPNTPQRIAAVNGWIACIQNNMTNAITSDEKSAALTEYQDFQELTAAGRRLGY
jgi:hypothetical protein